MNAGSLLENFATNNMRILELGCGVGVCGILASLLGAEVILSDRCIDLVTYNVDAVLRTISFPIRISTVNIDWNDWIMGAGADFGDIDVILGAEICCLSKQHEGLVSVIDALCGPRTVVLLTFDGSPPPNEGSAYETAFLLRMRALGFAAQLALYGRVEWTNDTPPSDVDMAASLPDGLPLMPPHSRRSYATLALSSEEAENIAVDTSPRNQHVLAFSRRSAGNTCSRCHCHFLHVCNSSFACRHHRGHYVCRDSSAMSVGSRGPGTGIDQEGEGTALLVI